MKFLSRFFVLFYIVLVIVMSFLCASYVANVFDFSYYGDYFHLIYTDYILRIAIGVVAVIMLCVNFMFYRLFTSNLERGKIIAFDNPSGRVSLSLLAMEDVLKRMLERLTEIKDVKLLIRPLKKGLNVRINLVVYSDLNIPEATHRIQDFVKKKIQDTIGVEGHIDIAIYIGKILPTPQREKFSGENKSENPDPPIPFRGYRA